MKWSLNKKNIMWSSFVSQFIHIGRKRKKNEDHLPQEVIAKSLRKCMWYTNCL